jgi:acetolactate synthase-1/2/3 large subunit
MTTAEAVVAGLYANGIDTLFCLPGVQNDEFFAALYAYRDRIRLIHTRHEQGAAYMALGAAMSTGKTAAYCVVPGPGFLNSTGALCTAYACNAPVLALTSQIPQAYIGRGLGFLHELPDQLGVMQRLTKWAERIREPQDAIPLVNEAFRQMTTGRPRPAKARRSTSNIRPRAVRPLSICRPFGGLRNCCVARSGRSWWSGAVRSTRAIG